MIDEKYGKSFSFCFSPGHRVYIQVSMEVELNGKMLLPQVSERTRKASLSRVGSRKQVDIQPLLPTLSIQNSTFTCHFKA